MSDLRVFIKKVWKLLVLLFIVPLIVIVIFIIGEYCLGKIDLSAGDWAGLLGAAFGYWGTVILGILSFWQNDRLSNANDKLAQLQIEEYTPYLIVKEAHITEHIDKNRNPDTTQSISKGSKGHIEMSPEQRIAYDSKMDKLIRKTAFSDVSELTTEKFEEINQAQMEIAKLRQSLPKSIKTEIYFDTFWILTNQVSKKSADGVTYYQLGDTFEDTKELERKSVKIILNNVSASNIKKIIIEKIEFSCCSYKWIFSTNPARNEIKDVLGPKEDLIFYLNIFFNKNDLDLVKLITIFDLYEIILNIQLTTIGNISQSEKILLNISFGDLSEYQIELS